MALENAVYKLPGRGGHNQTLRLLVTFLLVVSVFSVGMSSWSAWKLASIAGHWFAELGTPLVTLRGFPVMAPWAGLMYDSRLEQIPQFAGVFRVLLLWPLCVFSLWPLKWMMNRYVYEETDVHGSAHWASYEEIKKTGLLD